MSDRRVEALVRAAVEDLQPLVRAMQGQGWPVTVRAESDLPGGPVTVIVTVTVLPVVMQPVSD